MPLLLPTELSTHLYPEILDQITRADATISTRAITAAESEVASYLHRYDVEGMFTTPSTATGIGLEHLKTLVKDVACWQLLKLANPNVSLELFRSMYEDAIKFLDKVMKGQATPAGWPLKPDDPDTDENEGIGPVDWTSNTKRSNHY
jgi:phage gp36-like protein